MNLYVSVWMHICVGMHAHMYEGLRLMLGDCLSTNVALKGHASNCMFVCGSVHTSLGAHRGQKRESNRLELELQVIMS